MAYPLAGHMGASQTDGLVVGREQAQAEPSGRAIPFRPAEVCTVEGFAVRRPSISRGEAIRRTTPKGTAMSHHSASLVEADQEVRAVLDEVYAAWADNDATAFAEQDGTWRVQAFHNRPEHAA
ncbi:hypothetical protein AB0G15_14430 [Streptosporangium sp. NPDC023825]|uniref:hypothetical protein n=1 Tax=Streptosporangium sp. NPDC023825 TaxID=3154909 RepID=UPI003448A69E